MTPEELNNIANELKRLGGELNMSDSQKRAAQDIAQYIAKNRAAGTQNMGCRSGEGKGLPKPEGRDGVSRLSSI